MGRKTPPHKNNPKITEAKFRSMIVSALRNASRWWSPALEAKKDACVGVRVNKRTKKRAKHYKCAKCNGLFPDKEIDIDHKIPVVPVEGIKSYDEYIDRLFGCKDDYQILCKDPCHKEKTLKEKQLKKEYESKRRDNTKPS